jgi:hypothetical protein
VRTTADSAIGMALVYSIKHWQALSHYTENGMLEIDSNPVERLIRPVAMAENYMFVGSHQPARRSAMLYSLLETL